MITSSVEMKKLKYREVQLFKVTQLEPASDLGSLTPSSMLFGHSLLYYLPVDSMSGKP